MPFTWCTGMAASRLPVTSLSAFCSTPVSGSSPSVCRWHSSRHCRPACRPPLWQSPPQAFWRHWCLGSRSTLWTTPCCWSSLHGWRPRDPPSLRRAPTTPPPHSSRRPACPPSSLPAAPRPRAASGKRRRCHCRRCLRSGRQLRTLRRRERRRQGQTSRAEAAKRIAPQCMLLTKSIWQMQAPSWPCPRLGSEFLAALSFVPSMPLAQVLLGVAGYAVSCVPCSTAAIEKGIRAHLMLHAEYA
mmetsp:Transcript_75616/g.244842  ORF Transcript_75616/g.244842 Transcript_75616/m.244842 type:complete len:243 (-) Transcript_75616:30-758(-)